MNVFLKVRQFIRVLFGSLKTFAIMDKKEKTQIMEVDGYFTTTVLRRTHQSQFGLSSQK